MARTKTTTYGGSNKRRRVDQIPESSNAAEMRRDRGNAGDEPISSASSSSPVPRNASPSRHHSSSSSSSSDGLYEVFYMAATARAAIQREMEILDASPGRFSAGPIADNLHLWEGHVTGPADSPYAGGAFFLSIIFPRNFPNLPPRVRFKAQDIVHPNISTNGLIGLELLQAGTWNRGWSIAKILEAIVELLRRPRMEPETIVLQPGVAKIYKEDFGLYLATAQSWTEENLLKK